MIQIASTIWSGTLSVGLVNIPVKLHTAVREKDTKFHQINSATNNRIATKRVDAVTGEEVPYETIVKGYELSTDKHVIITPDELAALDPEKSSTIEIDKFVDPGDLDPMMFDKPYHLAPNNSDRSYALLHSAMRKTNTAAIGSVIIRERQHTVCVWTHGDELAISTLHFHDEVLPDVADVSGVEVDEAQVNMAVSLVESLKDEFDPTEYNDERRERVLEMIQNKADGVVTTSAPAPQANAPMADLLASLEASLKLAEKKKAEKTMKVSL